MAKMAMNMRHMSTQLGFPCRLPSLSDPMRAALPPRRRGGQAHEPRQPRTYRRLAARCVRCGGTAQRSNASAVRYSRSLSASARVVTFLLAFSLWHNNAQRLPARAGRRLARAWRP